MVQWNFVFVGLIVFLCASAIPAKSSPVTLRDDPDWKECIDLPVIGNTCLEVKLIPSSLTLDVILSVQGLVLINETWSADHLCVADAQLLELLELIPALAEFKPLIDWLVKIDKHIPAKVFSVCLKINDLKITSSEIDGCPSLDLTLMCWESKCLYKGEEDFPCFHIPV